jgi:hypothetical protein
MKKRAEGLLRKKTSYFFFICCILIFFANGYAFGCNDISGTWKLDIPCVSPYQQFSWQISGNGYFEDNVGTGGTWILTGDQVTLTYNDQYHTIYRGTVDTSLTHIWGYRSSDVGGTDPNEWCATRQSSFCTPTSIMVSPSSGQQTFVYSPVVSPEIDVNPSSAKPVGVGTVVAGGNEISIHVAFEQFANAVDIYLALYVPALSPEVWLIKSDQTLQPASAGLSKWKQGVTGPIDEPVLGNIPTNILPNGDYYFGVLVASADTMDNYYFWITNFNIATPAACTSFTYSDWTSCQSNGTQTRTMLTSSPSGCTGTPPASQLTQSCTYLPPSNTSNIAEEIRLAVLSANSLMYQITENIGETVVNLMNLQCSLSGNFSGQVVINNGSHTLNAIGQAALYSNSQSVGCDYILNSDSVLISRAHVSGSGSIDGNEIKSSFSGQFSITGSSGYLVNASDIFSVDIADFFIVNGSGTITNTSYAGHNFPDVSGQVSNVTIDLQGAINLADKVLSGATLNLGDVAEIVKSGAIIAQTQDCGNINIQFNGSTMIDVRSSCVSPNSFKVNVITGQIQ